MLAALGLSACASSPDEPIVITELIKLTLPSEAREPCPPPSSLPDDGGLSEAQVVSLWGADRVNLKTCAAPPDPFPAAPLPLMRLMPRRKQWGPTMVIEVETMLPVLSALALLISIGSFVHSVMTARAKGNSAKLETLEGEVDLLDRRTLEMQAEIKQLPGKDELKQLELSLTKMEGTLTATGQAVGRVSMTVDRIDNYLRNRGEGA